MRTSEMLGVGVLHGRRQRSCVLWDEADDRQGQSAHMSRLRGVIRAEVAKSFGLMQDTAVRFL